MCMIGQFRVNFSAFSPQIKENAITPHHHGPLLICTESYVFLERQMIKTRPNKDQYSIYDMDNKQNP